MQDALERTFAEDAQVQVAVVDYAVAVVMFDDDGAGCITRDLGHIEISRAEALRPCCPYDVAGRHWLGGQSASEARWQTSSHSMVCRTSPPLSGA